MITVHRKTIQETRFQTLCWQEDKVVDWASGGSSITVEGKQGAEGIYHYRYVFDRAISSIDGKYVLLFQKLGTKALLLKGGELLREINRSYYHADVYEYPAVFYTTSDGTTYLIHCPISYKQLDFENVETGEIVTQVPGREPEDVFHSRLEVSPDGKFLVSKGWFWHPWDCVLYFNIEACINNPALLDNGNFPWYAQTEICTASFIDNNHLLLGASAELPMIDDYDEKDPFSIPPGHIAVYNFQRNDLSPAIKVEANFGNLIAINHSYCWDLFDFPKIINIGTGKIEFQEEFLPTGKQRSSIILSSGNEIPLIGYNRDSQTLALGYLDRIEFLRTDK